MKKRRILSLLAAVCLFSLSCAERVVVKDVRGSQIEKLNTEDVKDAILIIDTRPNEEYKRNHIRNAINIPENEIKTRIAEVADWFNKPIFVYGRNIDESFESAKLFVQNGCKKIYNAEGVEEYSYDLVKYNSVRGIQFEMMLKEKNILIVDCRSNRAFKVSHIDEAISIPFMHLEKNLYKLSTNKTILLYDSVGTASARFADELIKMGFPNVYASIDGVNEYDFELVGNDN